MESGLIQAGRLRIDAFKLDFTNIVLYWNAIYYNYISREISHISGRPGVFLTGSGDLA